MSNRLKLIVTLVLSLVAAIAIGSIRTEKDNLKEALEHVLIDASSVRYGNTATFPSGLKCLEFNSKNTLGGYAGFHSGVFRKVNDKWFLMHTEDDSCKTLAERYGGVSP